jgi:hypothetical protein
MDKNFSLKEDIQRVEWLCLKCKSSKKYAQNLYAALCNNTFHKNDQEWSCSWRMAGEIVAEMVGNGSYLDWYCSGIIREKDFLEEGLVTTEINKDLLNLGWVTTHD